MSRAAYSKYRESGVKWLGKVPKDWPVRRARFMMQVNPSSPILRALSSDSEVSFVPMDAVGEYGGLRLDQTCTIAEIGSGYMEFQDGDVVVAKITPCFESGKGALAIDLVNKVAFGTTELHVLRVICDFDSRYLFFLTISDGYRKLGESTMSGAGGQKRISPEFCKDILLPFPPRVEQTVIANFIAREIARLDTLVAKQRELIALLKEKRTALISRTVTRGLPADAAREFGLEAHTRFKKSGIEWLGKVPHKWKVMPVKMVARVGNGSTPNRENPLYWEGGSYPWLNSSAVNQERITEAEQFVTPLALSECHLPRISPPAVLVGITGQGRTRGMASTLLMESTINQHVTYIKPLAQSAVAGYLRRVFDMTYLFLRNESDGGGSTKGAITCEQIKSLKIPVPTLGEQTAIATYLDRETGKLDQLIGKIETLIARLQEYRSALITATVTGKIDVRGAQA